MEAPQAQAQTAFPGDSFLLDQFREFYSEVVDFKHRIRTGDPLVAAPGGSGGSDDESAPRGGAALVGSRLLARLDTGARDVARQGGAYGSVLFKEAQYVMAAVADETFLALDDWDGKADWEKNLLETKLFKSYVAGNRLFEKIEELLASKTGSTELAALYLMVLTLGFRGRYRGRDDGGAIDAYKRRLHRYVISQEHDAGSAECLLPKSYARVESKEKIRYLPYIKGWLVAIAAWILLFLVVGHLAWNMSISGVERITGEQTAPTAGGQAATTPAPATVPPRSSPQRDPRTIGAPPVPPPARSSRPPAVSPPAASPAPPPPPPPPPGEG